MKRHVRVLIASPNGNGCGLALVRVSDEQVLALSVVPKWWSPYCEPISINLDKEMPPGLSVHEVIPELGRISLESHDAWLLDSVVAALTGLVFRDDGEGDDEPGETPLFAVVPERKIRLGSNSFLVGDSQRRDGSHLSEAFWSGVESIGSSDLIRLPIGQDSEHSALLAEQHLPDAPSFERVMRELFVKEVERVLTRRMPEFRRQVGVLPFIRGQISVESVIARQARKSLDVQCEFDELDNDHPWQRLVRTAVRAVAARDMTDFESSGNRAALRRANRCRTIDLRMADVPLISPNHALQVSPSAVRLSRNRHAAVAAHLAQQVLLKAAPVGFRRRRSHLPVIATGVRIASARLFERLLACVPTTPEGLQVHENQVRLTLLRGVPAGKRPDLLMTRNSEGGPRVVALIDAKNKARIASSPRLMSGKDQYQQFAYAVVSGLPTLFVFAASPSTDWQVSSTYETNLAGPKPGPHVATAQIPFPSPSEVLWVEQIAPSLGSVLNSFLQQVSLHSRDSRISTTTESH